MKPIVSVIIPNFNNTVFLGEMIDCIKKQTLSSWELIIVDDCSSDNSYQYALSYTNDKRIKVIQRNREPKGGQTCRNIGFENSVGKYVIFFDSDDLIADNCLEQRVDFLEVHDDLDFAIFPTHSFKPRVDYKTLNINDVVWGKRSDGDVLYRFLSNDYPFLVVSCIYRRSSILTISWDESIPVRQDLMYNLNVLFNGLKYDFCDSASFDYFYRGAHSVNNVSRNMTSTLKYNGMKNVFNFMFTKVEKCTNNESFYKKGIKRYIVSYANLLVSDNKSDLYKDYLMFCRSYYGNFTILRLKLAEICIRGISSSYRKEVSWIVFMILFWHKFYLDLVGKAFRRILPNISK